MNSPLTSAGLTLLVAPQMKKHGRLMAWHGWALIAGDSEGVDGGPQLLRLERARWGLTRSRSESRFGMLSLEKAMALHQSRFYARRVDDRTRFYARRVDDRDRAASAGTHQNEPTTVPPIA